VSEPEPQAPEDRAAVADERGVLTAFLDRYRDIVVAKARGLSDADARREMVPSGTSIGGLIKHLRWVETGWFHYVLGAGSGDNSRPHERAGEFRMEPGETLDGLIADYQEACRRSREIAAALPLEHRVPHWHTGEVSSRWIHVHLIEETARHAGHIDILREQLDGATGFD
jgi:uncharacterized damage-inducible protein DinB